MKCLDMFDEEAYFKKIVLSKDVVRRIKFDTVKKHKFDNDPFAKLIKFKKLQEPKKIFYTINILLTIKVFLFLGKMHDVI